MSERQEIAWALGRLQAELDDLAVGGLRAAGPERLPRLQSMQADLAAAGAEALASRLGALVEAIRAGGREAAPAFLRAQAGVRLFDRLLTLEDARARLAGGGSAA